MKRLLAILSAGVLLIAVPGAVSGADEVFSGTLRGSNEVPPVTTNAAGTGYVFINEAETEVKYAVSYTGMSGPPIAAHIHIGPAGSNGPIALPLQIGPSTMFGTLTQANFQSSAAATTWAAALDAIRAGNGYIHLHTSARPAGEIRAQLAPTAAPSPIATATPRPTARPTTAPTPRPTPRATPRVTLVPLDLPDPSHGRPPPTSTLPDSRRGSSSDLAPVLFVLLIAVLSGAIAVRKLEPARNKRDDWD